jgi:hypothetical protein
MFKFLDQGRKSNAQDNRGDVVRDAKADLDALARTARRHAEDQRGVDDARRRLTEAYQSFLGQLDKLYKAKNLAQRSRIEANYEVWAAFFELLKTNFQDLWSFLGVIQADVEGWHRVSPTGSELGFMDIGKEGYVFAAGIEQNDRKGAPFPKKWLTVTVAYTTSFISGIGDERMLGRKTPINDDLTGLADCTEKGMDAQERGAEEMKNRALAYPLVFTLCSETRGQHTTELPVTALETHSLSELCQPLLVALTNDDLKNVSQLLPDAGKLLLK